MGRRGEAAREDIATPESVGGGIKSSEVGFRDLTLESGGVRVDVKNFLAWVDGEPLELRIAEFALLANLVLHPGELKTRTELSGDLWEDFGSRSMRTIDVHVQRLRAALARRSSHDYIRSVRGLGYRFVPAGVTGTP